MTHQVKAGRQPAPGATELDTSGEWRARSSSRRSGARSVWHREFLRGGTRNRRRPAAPLAYADPPYPGKAWISPRSPGTRPVSVPARALSQLAAYDGWAL